MTAIEKRKNNKKMDKVHYSLSPMAMWLAMQSQLNHLSIEFVCILIRNNWVKFRKKDPNITIWVQMAQKITNKKVGHLSHRKMLNKTKLICFTIFPASSVAVKSILKLKFCTAWMDYNNACGTLVFQVTHIKHVFL